MIYRWLMLYIVVSEAVVRSSWSSCIIIIYHHLWAGTCIRKKWTSKQLLNVCAVCCILIILQRRGTNHYVIWQIAELVVVVVAEAAIVYHPSQTATVYLRDKNDDIIITQWFCLYSLLPPIILPLYKHLYGEIVIVVINLSSSLLPLPRSSSF